MMKPMSEQLPQEFAVRLGVTDAFGDAFDVLPDAEEFELGEGLEGDPAVAFRRTLGMFATGVTVLTTRAGEQVHGMTANAFTSVSLRPPLVLVSIDRRARMCDLLHEGSHFGVNVLEARQSALSDRFAGRVRADDAPEPSFAVVRDTPLIEGALAHFVARVVRSYWGGDHSLFLGNVEYAHYGEGEPLLFHGGRYERMVREQGVPAGLLRPLLEAAGAEHAYEAGAVIMQIGDPAEMLGLVLEGEVRVERPGRSVVLGPDDLIGEIEALDGGPRIATITAAGPVRVLEISRADLLSGLERDPAAALALVAVLAGRFRETA
jgi:flavin reductase (DIM6/NTAB) family NADH-FMN oxidoreductase RutF